MNGIRNRAEEIVLQELIRLISRNEEKLLATMTDEQKDLFSRYRNCTREFQAMAECMLFQNCFRLGAKIMLEAMKEGAYHSGPQRS